ncbi:hypothetical protein LRP31_05885 [Mesorhizobium mediterraneum]|uniref:Uncharacterized protein n=1 Tax=Mesorhizobium mediterraneum TaxID=43617 RepID=A0AB36R526_9HYPH|nr:hypothetical protein [Mesorhizobium mediterraneum]PAP99631.1 hypothetical protein CIT25_25005 [Mesorhizobium mediterraneum]RWN41487.1 MAG: hypothetical protein EOR96_11765 [Mesorhizobium sp.]WIW54767.1 hypothetical protein LRP31_05885 [Mesorhizobium mediterraneum]
MKSPAQRAKLTWNADRFEALERVRTALQESEFEPLYASYIRYLELRERGLRKQSFSQLDVFIGQIIADPFEIRLSIAQHLIGAIEGSWDYWPAPDNWQMPEQMLQTLIGPIWCEWREREPANPEAWVYNFGNQSRDVDGKEVAFLLEPSHPRYQYAYLSRLCGKLNYELHELEHIETILCAPAYFGELVGSLAAVAGAIGDNIADEVVETPPKLVELANFYRDHHSDRGTFLQELLQLGRQDLVDLYLLPAKRWFRVLPSPLV